MATARTLDERLDKIDAQLEAISAAVIKGFDRIDRALEAKADKEDVMRLLSAIDSFAKRLEVDGDERVVMGHQLERLDKWVHELAEKIGIVLSA